MRASHRKTKANVGIVAERIPNEATWGQLFDIIETLGRNRQLAINGDYTAAYQEFFAKHSEFANQANQKILDDVLIQQREPVTVENLENLLHPGSPNFVGDQLCLTTEALQVQADAAERERLVKEIGQGKDHYFTRLPSDGAMQKWVVAGLVEESLERLREIAAIISEERRLRGLSKEDSQATHQTFRTEERKALYAMRYPKLPDSYTPPGKDTPVPWSRTLIKKLPSVEISRLLRIYGEDQLEAAVAAAKGN
jgi:hypothetical protein